MRTLSFASLAACALMGGLLAQPAHAVFGDDYIPGRLSVRFHDHPEILRTGQEVLLGWKDLDEINASVAGLESIRHTSLNPYRGGLPDISLNYLLEFDDSVDMEKMAQLYEASGLVEYAEPDYLRPLYRMPDDPLIDNQWYLNPLDAEEAWDELPATPDNPDMIVAIIDSGVDWNHPDLIDILWHNPDEDLDGDQVVPGGSTPGEAAERNSIDDGSNGYVDDFYGWDWVVTSGCAGGEDCSTPDNDPMDFNGHGTHCSGIAVGDTDNGTGTASVVWNGRLMSLRAGYQASDGNGYVIQSAAANAVQYAIDNGAKIISMSFGGSNTVRTYATLAYNSGLLCFHAAGNDNVDNDDGLDRASGMISVAATNSGDCKADFSNYGDWVDISAPGTAIFAPIFNNNYTNLQGTSMACPLAASVAALIWNHNPDYSNLDVRAQLLATCDDIYHLNCNQEFAEDRELGAGRVNARKAILNIRETTIEIAEAQVTDDSGDGRFMPGEGLAIGLEVCNTGPNPTETVEISVATTDPDVSFPEGATMQMSAIPDAFCLDTFGDALPVMIAGGSAARFIPFEVTVATDNAPEPAVYEFEIMVGESDLLLYDDGAADNPIYNAYYNAFKDMGRVFDWYSTDEGGFPQFPGRDLNLSDYALVVYASGLNESTLDETEQGLFSSYEGTGDLIFSSQNADQDIGGTAFFSDVLRATTGDGTTPVRGAKGVEGDEMAGGLTMILTGANGANNQGVPVTEVNATDTPGTEACFTDYNLQFNTGVRHSDGGHHMVYCNFALEAAHGTAATAGLTEALGAIMGWMGQVDVAPRPLALPSELSLSPAWPNPFNPTTNLAFTLPRAADVRLAVYDLTGARVSVLAEGPLPAGEHRVVFEASRLASGLYFARLTADGVPAQPVKMILAR